ncbi:MAG: putative nucleotidyltransferase [Anaerocolumna sp.]|jgi:dTDP-glucose pyrophosphorylase|nr:putative nucleotidyltransferase [Anaerocolumna sp.]
MKVLIPIAGRDNEDNGNQYIKSLYEIEKKTVLQYVYESLNSIKNAEFIVVLRRSDVQKYHLDDMVRLLIPNVKIIIADGATSGSACSCLLAVDSIEDDEPLLITGGDQLMLVDPQYIINNFTTQDYDGGVVIFDDIHPRWSFVRLDSNDMVIEAAEKRPLSRNATTGFYYFKRGGDFINAAQEMIRKGASVNGQYFVCPTYNELVLKQKKIGVYRISKKEYFNFNQQKGMDDYEKYLKGVDSNV